MLPFSPPSSSRCTPSASPLITITTTVHFSVVYFRIFLPFSFLFSRAHEGTSRQTSRCKPEQGQRHGSSLTVPICISIASSTSCLRLIYSSIVTVTSPSLSYSHPSLLIPSTFSIPSGLGTTPPCQAVRPSSCLAILAIRAVHCWRSWWISISVSTLIFLSALPRVRFLGP